MSYYAAMSNYILKLTQKSAEVKNLKIKEILMKNKYF
jgi:hypothetical protein